MRDSLDQWLEGVTPLVIWKVWLEPAVYLVLGLAVGLAAEKIIVSAVRKILRHQSIELNEYLISTIRGLVWCLLLLWGLNLATYSIPMNEHNVATLRMLILMIGMVLVIRMVANASVTLARFYLNHTWTMALPNTSIFENIIRIVIYGMGFMVLLQTMGISIWPLITAVGAGGLAVSLALQDTLANLFAGVQMLLARQIRVGDTIQLENGLSGKVEDIGWRTTMLRQLSGNRVILPNNKMAANIIVNYTLPHPDLTVSFPVEVPIVEDPRKMEEWVMAAATHSAAALMPDQTPPEPVVRFVGYGDTTMQMTVSVAFNAPMEGARVRHEFFKAFHERLVSEQVRLPFPKHGVLVDFPEQRWTGFTPQHDGKADPS